MLSSWVLEKLQALKDEQVLLVQDSLRLLPEADGAVHRFANESGFTARPGGLRDRPNYDVNVDYTNRAYFWSASESRKRSMA